MKDPFKIDGPALISFSGGRTSGYMLWRILQAHSGTLPENVKVAFANTGKEAPQTLDFVRDCAERWGVEIVWLEYTPHEEASQRWKIVTHKTASRDGKPFADMLAAHNFLPNPTMRFCTQVLKMRPAKYYVRSLGWPKDWTSVLGLRADERHRVARLNPHSEGLFERIAPLATAGITKRDVQAFWAKQNFDLRLPNINGTTPAGNCDLCFLKNIATVQGLIRANPESANWWIEQEKIAERRFGKGGGEVFRRDRPNYAALKNAVINQRDFDFGDADKTIDCFCTEDQE